MNRIACGLSIGDLPLVRRRALWRVFPGREAPPSDWMNADFDDCEWLPRVAGFGYNYDGITSYVQGPPGEYVTLYIRRGFTVADPAAIENLVLAMRYDDGVVAYLNGVEVVRENVSVFSGSHTSRATDTHSADYFEEFDLTSVKTFSFPDRTASRSSCTTPIRTTAGSRSRPSCSPERFSPRRIDARRSRTRSSSRTARSAYARAGCRNRSRRMGHAHESSRCPRPALPDARAGHAGALARFAGPGGRRHRLLDDRVRPNVSRERKRRYRPRRGDRDVRRWRWCSWRCLQLRLGDVELRRQVTRRRTAGTSRTERISAPFSERSSGGTSATRTRSFSSRFRPSAPRLGWIRTVSRRSVSSSRI